MTARRRAWLAPLLAAALIGGCGDDDENGNENRNGNGEAPLNTERPERGSPEREPPDTQRRDGGEQGGGGGGGEEDGGY